MALVTLDAIAADLVCPRCRNSLASRKNVYRCTNGECAAAYDVIGGQPILVEFGDSILIEHEVRSRAAASAIGRGEAHGLKRRITKALAPRNRVAAVNASRFIDLSRTLAEQPKILIVGGASKGEGTEELYANPALQLIAFDIYASELTQFIADAHRIPLADASVDAVWIQAVLEHVLDPWRVTAELHRVLKPGGLVYAETPFLQQVHEGAYDFTRFTESGHRWLFRRFAEVDAGVALGPGSQLLWSIEHVARGLFRSFTVGVIAKMLLFWLRYFDRLIPPAYAGDAAFAVYFLGRKSGSAIRPSDMIAHYKGAHPRRS